MKFVLLVIMVVLILISCVDSTNVIIDNRLGNLFGGKIPGHKILPIIKIILAIVMMFMGYSLLTKICLIIVILQSLYFIKKY